MENQIKILAIAGSLRRGSYNKALIRAAIEVAPTNMLIEVYDLEGIPPFNQDFEDLPPSIIVQFKQKIREADALLIATPEYNYSVSGASRTRSTVHQDPKRITRWKANPSP